MLDHYIELETDRLLTTIEHDFFKRLVQIVFGEKFSHTEIKVTDDKTQYVVNLHEAPTEQECETIVEQWGSMYDDDFELSMSADFPEDCSECEFSNEVIEHISYVASKFLHEQWLHEKLNEGWRYGTAISSKDKTHTKLMNWDNLHESLRPSMKLSQESAIQFLQEHPELFS